MTAIELLGLIETKETSTVQFKAELPHKDDFAKEMIAMSNSLGGALLIGVRDKTGELLGLTDEQIHRYGQDIGSIASDKIVPNIYVTTEVIPVGEPSKKVLVIHIRKGNNKPYKDRNGNVYVKQADTTRRVTDNNELARLFQESSNLTADEMEVFETSISDVDSSKFEAYFRNEFGVSIAESGMNLEKALRAKRILRNEHLTLAGLLFFGNNPQLYRPAFCIKAVSFFGNDLGGNDYRDSKDIIGTIPDMFEDGMRFLTTNLHQIQKGKNFNSTGVLEISRIALEEILQNALLHRDYYKNSPVRILVFDNRIEIISPGKLPNSLTVEDVRYGNPVIRNNQLVAFGSRLLPYRGLGSGVRRAIKEQPNIELENDMTGERFIVTIPRSDTSN
jgi:predicted HTH transcriptional regulator